MKRLSTLLALGLGMATLANAQAPDVPDNHWAANAVRDLYRIGVLQGYPDGLYRGNRPASRYELAQALSGFYSRNRSVLDDLQKQIDALKTREPQSDVEGLAEIRARLDAAEDRVVLYQRQQAETKDLMKTYENLLEQVRALREKARSR